MRLFGAIDLQATLSAPAVASTPAAPLFSALPRLDSEIPIGQNTRQADKSAKVIGYIVISCAPYASPVDIQRNHRK